MLIKVMVSAGPGEHKTFFVNVDENKYKTDKDSLLGVAHDIADKYCGEHRWATYSIIHDIIEYEE